MESNYDYGIEYIRFTSSSLIFDNNERNFKTISLVMFLKKCAFVMNTRRAILLTFFKFTESSEIFKTYRNNKLFPSILFHQHFHLAKITFTQLSFLLKIPSNRINLSLQHFTSEP